MQLCMHACTAPLPCDGELVRQWCAKCSQYVTSACRHTLCLCFALCFGVFPGLHPRALPDPSAYGCLSNACALSGAATLIWPAPHLTPLDPQARSSPCRAWWTWCLRCRTLRSPPPPRSAAAAWWVCSAPWKAQCCAIEHRGTMCARPIPWVLLGTSAARLAVLHHAQRLQDVEQGTSLQHPQCSPKWMWATACCTPKACLWPWSVLMAHAKYALGMPSPLAGLLRQARHAQPFSLLNYPQPACRCLTYLYTLSAIACRCLTCLRSTPTHCLSLPDPPSLARALPLHAGVRPALPAGLAPHCAELDADAAHGHRHAQV